VESQEGDIIQSAVGRAILPSAFVAFGARYGLRYLGLSRMPGIGIVWPTVIGFTIFYSYGRSQYKKIVFPKIPHWIEAAADDPNPLTASMHGDYYCATIATPQEDLTDQEKKWIAGSADFIAKCREPCEKYYAKFPDIKRLSSTANKPTQSRDAPHRQPHPNETVAPPRHTEHKAHDSREETDQDFDATIQDHINQNPYRIEEVDKEDDQEKKKKRQRKPRRPQDEQRQSQEPIPEDEPTVSSPDDEEDFEKRRSERREARKKKKDEWHDDDE